jgi:hypothetical protein
MLIRGSDQRERGTLPWRLASAILDRVLYSLSCAAYYPNRFGLSLGVGLAFTYFPIVNYKYKT